MDSWGSTTNGLTSGMRLVVVEAGVVAGAGCNLKKTFEKKFNLNNQLPRNK